MTATTERRASSRTAIIIGVVLVLVLVGIALLGGDSSKGSGPPLSPSSTDGDGTRGLALLLQDLGAEVRLGDRLPDDHARVALLLNDGLTSDDRARVRGWVAAGGTLVVTDPSSPLSAPHTLSEAIGLLEPGRCTMPELADVEQLQTGFAPGLQARGDRSCFGDSSSAFVVGTPLGNGQIVSIASPTVLTNTFLDQADNSVLAARLLVPAPATSIAFLDPNAPGSGRTKLFDLVSDRVFQAIIQLGVAFLLYALWRSRRVGQPVSEPQPVAIAGSQFVQAVGGLQQRSHATTRAATALRMETRRVVCERYGIPLYADVETLAAAAAARAGLDRAAVAAALRDTPILDEESLVALGHSLDAIRQEVMDERRR